MKSHPALKCFCVLTVVSLSLLGCSKGPKLNPIAKLKESASKIEPEDDRLKVMSTLVEMEGVSAVQPYFSSCFGCAIFPTVGKGGFVVGGAHGAGWVFRKGELTGISKMTQVTLGLQAGGQAFTQLIFFEDEKSYINFTSGNFEFGAQASAVAITASASASASTAGGTNAGANLGSDATQTKSDYTNGMAIFTLAKGGLMYEASVGGQKFNFEAIAPPAK